MLHSMILDRRRRLLEGLIAREILAPVAFVVAILASNYALAGMPNVKLFDLLVLAAGYSMGLRRGVVVAVIGWLIYGHINPWGFAHASLLTTMMGSEVAYVVAGVLLRKLFSPDQIRLSPNHLNLALLCAALVATLAYDFTTNAFTAYMWANMAGGSDYLNWFSVALFGPGALLFMLIHVGSNALLFPVFGPLILKGIERSKTSWGWW